MALFTRKEFCNEAGITQGYLKTYINRGKVILTDNKIDTSIPENLLFLESRLASKESGKKKLKITPNGLDTEQKEEIKHLAIKQKQAHLRRTTAEAYKKELEVEKMKGQLMPLSVSLNIISNLSKTFMHSFHDLGEKIIFDIAHQHRMTNEEIARYRGELVDFINVTMKEIANRAKIDLNDLADEIKRENRRSKNNRPTSD